MRTIIVGAGSSGGALAARLSETSQRRHHEVGLVIKFFHGHFTSVTLLKVCGDFLQCLLGQPSQVKTGKVGPGRACMQWHR